jgi:hypothetical protein
MFQGKPRAFPRFEWKGSSRTRFSGGRSEKKATDTITNKWIIKKGTSLSSFFLVFFKIVQNRNRPRGRSIDDRFFSMLYISPEGEEKTCPNHYPLKTKKSSG